MIDADKMPPQHFTCSRWWSQPWGQVSWCFSPPSAETTLLQTRLWKGAIKYFLHEIRSLEQVSYMKKAPKREGKRLLWKVLLPNLVFCAWCNKRFLPEYIRVGLCCRAPEAHNTKTEIKLPIQVLWLLAECIQVIIQHVVLYIILFIWRGPSITQIRKVRPPRWMQKCARSFSKI